jgi:hypothetical protein
MGTFLMAIRSHFSIFFTSLVTRRNKNKFTRRVIERGA